MSVSNTIRELSTDEINAVAGGPLIIIVPKVIVGKKALTWAAGLGGAAGVAGATVALTND